MPLLRGPGSLARTASIFVVLCFLWFLSSFPVPAHAKPGEGAGNHRPSRPHDATTVLNLRDYGALGDGLANDSPALQQALDDLASAGGGTLHVPAGQYLLGTAVLKQFAPGSEVTIEGELSSTPIDVAGNGTGLDLTSQFLVAVGETNQAITLSGSDALLITDVGFVGVQEVQSDARIVLSLSDIGQLTIRHCEFYGLASLVPGGAIIAAHHTDLRLEQCAFLGCAANSGVTTSVVENSSWIGIAVTDCKFIDYGNRPDFYSKTPLAPPYSWISIGPAAAPEPNWSRREAVVRNVFLDEGAWIGIAARPDLFGPSFARYEVYLSRLYVNVTNLGGSGVYISGAQKAFVERSHFGWSHNAGAAIIFSGGGEAILDLDECVLDADKILVDAERVALINSIYATLNSTAPFTRVITTNTPGEDPAQYVSQQYLIALNHGPDPAGHFYWTDQIVRCDSDASCISEVQTALAVFLNAPPPPRFSVSGQVLDENGAPLASATVSLSGSQTVATETGADGTFTFSNLATAGNYVLTPAKTHYTFESRLLVTPTSDQVQNFTGTLIHHSISGRVYANTGLVLPGAILTLSGSQSGEIVSDASGDFTFPDLPGGGGYEESVARDNYVFDTSSRAFTDLSSEQFVVFGGVLLNYAIAGRLVKADGAPVSNALVTLSGSTGISLTTGSDGNYSFTVPGDGNYIVTPTRSNYTFDPPSQSFTNLSGKQNADFAGGPVDFVVSGQVNSSDGAYLSGVTLTTSGSETKVTVTDQSNNYLLSLEAEGDYILTPSKPNYTFAPASIAIDDLAAHRTLNFTAFVNPGVPVLMAGTDPTRTVALDSVLRTGEPFKLEYDYPWVADRRTRLMLFATHFDLLPGEGALSVTATLEDAGHRIYPLTVEYAGKLEGLGSLTCIVVRLSDDLTEAGDVLVRITHHGLTSEPMRIGIGPPGAGSAALLAPP